MVRDARVVFFKDCTRSTVSAKLIDGPGHRSGQLSQSIPGCDFADTVNQAKPLVVLNQGQTRADDICQHKFDEAIELLASAPNA